MARAGRVDGPREPRLRGSGRRPGAGHAWDGRRRAARACPNSSRYLSAFCTSRPATIPIVVGSDAAHTPSRLSVFSSMPDATMSGGAHSKHASSPGLSSWMWPETASSETPDSSHTCPSSLHAWLIDMRAWKLSTHESTRSTGPSVRPPLLIRPKKWSKLPMVVMS